MIWLLALAMDRFWINDQNTSITQCVTMDTDQRHLGSSDCLFEFPFVCSRFIYHDNPSQSTQASLGRYITNMYKDPSLQSAQASLERYIARMYKAPYLQSAQATNSLSPDAWTNCGGYIFAIPPEKRSREWVLTICNNYRLQVASFRGQNMQGINAMLWSCGRMDRFKSNNYYMMNSSEERSSNYSYLFRERRKLEKSTTRPSESFAICDAKSNSA
ncbi:hypothetical protein DPMN_071454, partial [Dreissena polymorpha]